MPNQSWRATEQRRPSIYYCCLYLVWHPRKGSINHIVFLILFCINLLCIDACIVHHFVVLFLLSSLFSLSVTKFQSLLTIIGFLPLFILHAIIPRTLTSTHLHATMIKDRQASGTTSTTHLSEYKQMVGSIDNSSLFRSWEVSRPGSWMSRPNKMPLGYDLISTEEPSNLATV